ncbi:orotidine-5'-phosphate decarboxylase [Desulfonauticus submarinus]
MKENICEEAQKRLIFALDVPDKKKAFFWVDLLKDKIGVFKIGLELFLSTGPDIIREIKKRTGAQIFLDLKLHDIPATILAACRQAVFYGMDFLTVHVPPYKGLFNEFSSTRTKIIGVTVLTSLETEDLLNLGIARELAIHPEKLALKRAQLAKEAGCAGVVCSGREVKKIKELFGEDFITITPGIRLKQDNVHDQKRVVTPYMAIRNGSDYIVVGRSIRHASDPLHAIRQITAEVASALKEITPPRG